MVSGKALVFSLSVIDEVLAAQIDAIPFDNPLGWKDWIEKGVKKGDLNCTSIFLDGEPIGMLTWVIDGEAVRELLVSSLSVFGHPKIDMVEMVTIYAEKLAKMNECKSIRFHTVRRGLVAKALKHGFFASEIVMRKKL